jgi:hypothetical protein
MRRVKNTVAGEDHPKVAGDIENVAGIGGNLAQSSDEGCHDVRENQFVCGPKKIGPHA